MTGWTTARSVRNGRGSERQRDSFGPRSKVDLPVMRGSHAVSVVHGGEATGARLGAENPAHDLAQSNSAPTKASAPAVSAILKVRNAPRHSALRERGADCKQ
jgi:hypothetical protein